MNYSTTAEILKTPENRMTASAPRRNSAEAGTPSVLTLTAWYAVAWMPFGNAVDLSTT